MSYQVLARKFRPGTFAGLVGQDHVVQALSHALDHDRLHHAYLFTGTRGVGKTTIARVLAKCLNCEQGVSSTPCGECSICQEVNENRFIDLIEVDAASRTRVDDTRELLENAQYLPTRGRYKVYLVDEVHMLSASSFNALLKTLEEPPEHVKFLLATTDPKKVPVTVLSRCLQFQLKNITPERTVAYLVEVLEQEGIPFEEGALTIIGKAARGSMRDALSITDQAIGFGQGALTTDTVADMLGLVGRDEIGALVAALAGGEPANVLAVMEELADRSVDFDTLLAELLASLHEMAVDHALGRADGVPFSAETVQLLYQIGLMGYRDLSIAPDPKSGVEMTLLRMLSFAPDEDGMKVPQIARPESQSEAGSSASPTESAPQKSPSGTPQAPRSAVVAETADAAAPAGESAAAATPIEQQAVESASRVPVTSGDGTWHDLVADLELGGVARMIAEHCVPAEQDGLTAAQNDRISLVLDQAHDTLLSDAQSRVIERALCERLGRTIRLEIQPGEVDEETPAARRARLQTERQRDAEELLATDESVQTLLDAFDGRLDDVQPVDGAKQTGGISR
jgi:DNA polymerase-3 subunit gamma/tau